MRKFILLGVLLMTITGVVRAQESGKNIYDFTVETIDGEQKSLADYKGKVLLIVNTASRCGFTSQYQGLEALYQDNKAKGFEVLAFPANNFMGQEPGTNEEIKSFCSLKFKTTFPLFAKSSVRGNDISPLYAYLTNESGFNGPISWNFNKFLINQEGKVIARFDSRVKPQDPEIVQALETALNSKS